MIPYQKEKIDNTICIFAKEYKKKTRKSISQSTMYKMLSLFDYLSLTEIGQPALGLKHQAFEHGPVPIEIYEKRNCYNTNLCKTIPGRMIGSKLSVEFVSKEGVEPELKYFSEYELDLMKKLLLWFANSSVKTMHTSVASHQVIKGWDQILAKYKNKHYSYDEYFPEIKKKDKSEYTPAETKYYIATKLKELSCETR